MGKQRTGLAVGLNKGHITVPITNKTKPSKLKGRLNPRIKNIREVMTMTCGYAPFERRCFELLKVGTAASIKRSLKFCKQRLGTHKRGKRRRDKLQSILDAAKRRQKTE